MAYTIYKEQTAPVLGVLFDMDGVVLDTEKLYARFWAEAAHALGYPMTYEQALGMRSLNPAAGQEKLESYFGPGVSRTVMRDKRVELMDAYVKANGRFPIMDISKNANGDTVILTGDGSGNFLKYTFSE